jgi:hypothetical protein
MRYPPFDTDAARNKLRHELNQMPGVDISEGQIRGSPSFPLAILEDAANLARLVGVLDRIATESHTAMAPENDAQGAAIQPTSMIDAPERSTVSV